MTQATERAAPTAWERLHKRFPRAQSFRSWTIDANDGIIGTSGILEGFAGAGATHSVLVTAASAATIAGALGLGGSWRILFGLAAVGVLGITWFLVQGLGLPDWVFAGAIALLAVGLPIVLETSRHERRRAAISARPGYAPAAVSLMPLKGGNA